MGSPAARLTAVWVESCHSPSRNAYLSSSLFRMAGVNIAVEHPMNYFRPLITKWNESLKGKNFPRRVTAPNGTRWVEC